MENDAKSSLANLLSDLSEIAQFAEQSAAATKRNSKGFSHIALRIRSACARARENALQSDQG